MRRPKPRRSIASAALILALTSACDRDRGVSATPDAKLTKTAPAIPGPWRARKRGPTWSGDPRPRPDPREVLRTSTWLPVVVEGGAPTISLHWIDGNADLATGRVAIRLRRAAFGARASANAAAGVIAEDALDSAKLDHGPSGLLLIGPQGTCVAKADAPLAAQRDAFGRVIEVLRTLVGCAGTSWAPLGLLSTQVPSSLSWRADACAEDEDTQRVATYVQSEAALTHLPVASGRFMLGEDTAAWLFIGAETWWLVVVDPTADAPGSIMTITDHGAEPPACAAAQAEAPAQPTTDLAPELNELNP